MGKHHLASGSCWVGFIRELIINLGMCPSEIKWVWLILPCGSGMDGERTPSLTFGWHTAVCVCAHLQGCAAISCSPFCPPPDTCGFLWGCFVFFFFLQLVNPYSDFSAVILHSDILHNGFFINVYELEFLNWSILGFIRSISWPENPCFTSVQPSKSTWRCFGVTTAEMRSTVTSETLIIHLEV